MFKHLENGMNFEEEISKGLVLVDFFATWCGPCRMLTPVLEDLADEYPEINILKVDVDQFHELASEYRIEAVPTLILFKNGEQKDLAMGFMPKPKLIRFIQNANK